MILSIALISKRNRPLYISSGELHHHLFSHAALDIFRERIAADAHKADCDFGLLFFADNISTYGYCTNTGVKIVVLIVGGEGSSDIKLVRQLPEAKLITQIFKHVHSAYIRQCCNPFYNIDDDDTQQIKSPKFRRSLEAIIEQYH